MPTFAYTAFDPEGHKVQGQIDADDEALARKALDDQGLTVEDIVQVADAVDPTPSPDETSKLRDAEAVELTARLAELTDIDLPLAPGLLAAAEEIAAEPGGARLAAVMRDMAARIESGESLESIMDKAAGRLPSQLRGIINAGVGVGRLDETLNWLIQHQRAERRLRRRVSSALLYPLCLFGATFVVFLLFSILVLPAFRKIFDDFGAELPDATSFMFWFVDGVWKLGLVAAAVVVVAVFVLRACGGQRLVHRALHGLPLIGRIYLYNGLSELGGLLALLTRHGMPLPAALRLTGDAVRDRALGAACSRLADEVAAGKPLASRLTTTYAPLRRLQPLLEWGEGHNALPESFGYLDETYEAWADYQAQYLRIVIPPFVFVFVLWSVSWVVVGLMLPLIKLIQALT